MLRGTAVSLSVAAEPGLLALGEIDKLPAGLGDFYGEQLTRLDPHVVARVVRADGLDLYRTGRPRSQLA